MLTKKLAEGCLYVSLSNNPLQNNELQELNASIDEKGGCDTILDFSRVEVLTSPCISNLLIMQALLKDKGYRLIFCDVAFLNKCVFTVCGLQDEFVFAKDKEQALETLKLVHTGA
jgi:anti-anti-sigma regulatory factor